MLLNYKKRKNEKGFAIALALLMLVAMSLMGASLMVIAASDHKQNGNLNIKQQSFYAAETGITEAKKWLSTQSALTIGSDPSNQLSFCKTSLFNELTNPKAVKDYVEKKDLSELIVGESIESLIENRFLAKANMYSYNVGLTSLVVGANGDYTVKSSEDLYTNNEMLSKLMEAYKERCDNKKTLIFNKQI